MKTLWQVAGLMFLIMAVIQATVGDTEKAIFYVGLLIYVTLQEREMSE